MDYKKAYYTLFNEITDTINYLNEDSFQPRGDRLRVARNMLMLAQSRTELLVISQPSEEDEVGEKTPGETDPLT